MSALAAVPVPAPLDVFGPSNSLYPFVLPHLPDVLTRIVIHYASPLFPCQHHYSGNAIMHANCHAAFNTRTAALLCSSPAARTAPLSRPFSLSGALTVCGWLHRSRTDKAAFLLSIHSNAPHSPHHPYVFVGYVPFLQTGQLQLSARYAVDDLLSAPHTAVQPTDYHGWEYIALTFQPHTADQPAEQLDDDDDDTDEPTTGTRRLYHNGALIAQDECPPLPLHTDFHLLLGRYDTRSLAPSLHGGLCDVRVYSRAVGEDEVQRLFEGEDVSEEGLEVRWRMDVSQQGEEKYVRDSSGHARHALVPGYPVEVSLTGSAGECRETRGQGSDGDEDNEADPLVPSHSTQADSPLSSVLRVRGSIDR